MRQTFLPTLPSEKLFSFSHRDSDNVSLLRSVTGKGFSQTFHPEKGLVVMVGDWQQVSGMALNKDSLPASENHGFYLSYLLEPQGQASVPRPNTIEKNILQSSIVSAADTKIQIDPMAGYRCVTIRFSREWLLSVLQTNCTLQQLHENINWIEKLALVQRITTDESNMLEDLIHRSENPPVGCFYIKSAALKLVCDFLYTLSNEQVFLTGTGPSSSLDGVERYLCENIHKEFAGTKALAKQFAMSESTLKRKFKKRFGVSTTVYSTQKKMHYARKLIQEKAITLAEAARMVGYRSVQNFKEMFRKYGNPVQDTDREQNVVMTLISP